jgi:hypothetical protein
MPSSVAVCDTNNVEINPMTRKCVHIRDCRDILENKTVAEVNPLNLRMKLKLLQNKIQIHYVGLGVDELVQPGTEKQEFNGNEIIDDDETGF